MSDRVLIRIVVVLLVTFGGIALYTAFNLRSGNVSPKNQSDPIPEEMSTMHGETSDGDGPKDLDGENLYSEFSIPEFSLTGRYKETVTHEVLDGQYTVVDFFFTSCPLWCPGMTKAMHKVQQATYGTELKLMSISIDGEVDTPEAIDAYAEAYRADEERWQFLTGDPQVVADLVKVGLKFDLGDLTSSDSADRLINHPTRLILLGPDRKVLGLYRYDDLDEVDKLIRDAMKHME